LLHSDYPDDAFDYVILSQTLQATRRPRDVLEHMLRIGRRDRVVSEFRSLAYPAAAASSASSLASRVKNPWRSIHGARLYGSMCRGGSGIRSANGRSFC
jgi:ubiquinone/menaquinone biosynthesis C-methylase UbiE